jgi:hypothetical protein
VVAVLAVALVQRLEQDVGTREVAEHGAGAAVAERRIARGPREDVEDRGARQEFGVRTREPGHDLVAQVVGHEPVGASEPLDRASSIGPVPHCERGQLQAGGPTLGPTQELDDVVARQVEPVRAQERRGLAPRHREIPRAKLQQPPLGSPSPDRELWFAAGGERQLRPVRHVVGERGERGEHVGRGEGVDVIERQHERPAARQRTRERGQHGGGVRAARPREREEHLVVDRDDRGECPGDRFEQLVGGVVRGAQREEGERARVPPGPLRQERRLAVARRRGDQHDGCVTGLREASDEPLAHHCLGRLARSVHAWRCGP